MFKICIIGAGSLTFSRTLVRDLLSMKEFQNTIEIAFMDIDQKNLDIVYKLVERDLKVNGLTNKITATTDRREAIKGAKYILNLARIGGAEAFHPDVEIPYRYGVDQCVGDTLCAGGIMYGQRGIPEVLDFCKDVRELAAEDALFLNYGNPNAMLTWAINKYGGVKCLGLCHGVQGGAHLIRVALGIDELDYICAGINHQTWYIQLKHKGKEIKQEDLLAAIEAHPDFSRSEKVRIDMMKRFGYFSTESNGHLSEYVPWYRKRLDEIKDWVDVSCWIHGESGGYLTEIQRERDELDHDVNKYMKEEPWVFSEENISAEHGSHIIRGLELNDVYRGHFNVVNNGVITNLPDDAIVEVPGYVDANGINIPLVGDLPLGCAAVCNASISVQRLAVEAAVHGDINLLRQAFMMDPLVGAVCNPPEIWQMVDEMLVAEEKWLPQYKEEIERAKERLADKSKWIPVKEGAKGAALRPELADK